MPVKALLLSCHAICACAGVIEGPSHYFTACKSSMSGIKLLMFMPYAVCRATIRLRYLITAMVQYHYLISAVHLALHQQTATCTSAPCLVRSYQKSTQLLKAIQSTVLPCITTRFVLIDKNQNIRDCVCKRFPGCITYDNYIHITQPVHRKL